MTGVDTNVVVRLLTRDDEGQARRAARIFQAEDVWLPKTVLLETEWVLRSAYSLRREVILSSFRTLLGLPSLAVEDRPTVLRALAWYEDGLDFADALHLASLRPADRFVTFDVALARDGRRIEGAPSVTEI